eukprot:TRINITY_DN595_c1_g1_i1.p1 TRINITY_DN595_c1_g1~~TRINITY_DN595_c1_g1_i1.p1  ORF type:complete len:456 (+),score=109.73 TRINITY_DN595_c1_g1_i1:35-1402(+)
MSWLGDMFTTPQPKRGKKVRKTVYASEGVKQQQQQQQQQQQHHVQHQTYAQEQYVDRPPVAEVLREDPPPSIQGAQPLLIEGCATGVTKTTTSKKKKKKTKKPALPRARNILVLGKQHAGKSAFINTYRRAITGGDAWATAPVGRAASRGTACYEPYYDQAGEVRWVLVDTAGRRFNKGLESSPDEAMLYDKMLKGLEWKSDLVSENTENSWRQSKVVPANTIDHVVFVIPSTDILKDNGIATVPFLSTRFEPSISRVKDLATRFSWWENHLGNAPFVVVTHMDRVGKYTWGMDDALEAKIRGCLGQIVHSNRVFCITNPDDPADLSPATEKRLKAMHRKLELDVEARGSSVLKGRNNKWGAGGESEEPDSSSSEEEGKRETKEKEDIPEVNTSLPDRASSSYFVEEPDDTYDTFPRAQSSPLSFNHQAQRRYNTQAKPGGGAFLYSMSMAQPKR